MNIKEIYTDPRARKHILPTRVVWKSKSLPEKNANLLLRGSIGNASPWSDPGCFLKKNQAVCLDFGKEIHGGIKIITGTTDNDMSKIRVRFGESVTEAMKKPNNEHAVHDTVIDLPWHGSVEFGNTGFRFVRIDVLKSDKPLEIKAVHAVAVYRDLEYKGKFECSDDRLNQIWMTGAYTVHLNMQDYLWDGIKRDRLVWLGDMHPEVKVICSVFDDEDVVPKSLDFAKEQAPAPKWINGISSYSLWWIIIQKEWFYYKGNLEYLKEQKDYLLGLLDLLYKCVDDSGNEKLSGLRFLDWPTQNDKKAIHAGLQALLILAFNAAAYLCLELSESNAKDKCIYYMEKLKSQNPDAGSNKQANALKVLAGLSDATETNRKFLAKNPFSGISTFYGYYVLEARARAGDYNGAMDLIKKYWGGMLDMGATTFWEDFDLNWIKNATRIDELPQKGKKDIHKDFGNYCYKSLRHSLCHGWAGGPTAWLTEHVLGFKPLAPGCKKLGITPNPGHLKWAKGAMPTPYGTVEVLHKKNAKGVIETEITSPDEIDIYSSHV